jgi:hypothetical protein
MTGEAGAARPAGTSVRASIDHPRVPFPADLDSDAILSQARVEDPSIRQA